jgi:hypothetical protein
MLFLMEKKQIALIPYGSITRATRTRSKTSKNMRRSVAL